MFSQPNPTGLPPIPPLYTPLYSGRLQIGVLNHHTGVITLRHSPLPLRAMGLAPGSLIINHRNESYGYLATGGQVVRF
ncbi:MAG: hypothetical protein AAFR67_16595 [Chloroflexota bacterium]